MQIILTKDVDKLGYANDIVEVKPGYANNFLIPQGYAKVATVTARKILAENLKQRAHKDAKIQADAQALADKLALLPLVFKVKASESGRIFGSVTSQMVAEALAAKGVEVDKKLITVESFKTLGAYTAEVRLHKFVKGTINFTVEPEGALIKEEKEEAPAPRKAPAAKAVEEAPVAVEAAEAEAAAEVEVAAEAAPEVAPEAPVVE
jgi:large subunit ribosomal protein L9